MKKINKKAATSKAVKNKKASGSNTKTPMYILLGVITFLLVLTISLAAVYCYTNPATDNENPFGELPSENAGLQNDNQQNKEEENKPQKGPDGRNNNMYNLLVMGKDYWSGSTDVLILLSVNTANDEINVLQIPRDSTVDCGVNENHGKRVNAIYAYARQALRREAANPSKEYDDPVMAKIAPLYISGLKKATDSDAKKYNDELLNKMGAEYLREVIKRTFCIAIDGYVMVDTAGFREIVDVLDGVEVDVPMNMHYEDPEQNLYIHLNKGLQTLNGKQAEGFVRYRYGYADGDIGRVNAQKIFVTALAKKLLSFSTVTKIQPVIETCMDYTMTNLSTSSILGYAKIMLGMNMNNIKFYTCPGESYRTSSGAWYYSLYMNENLEIINQHFNDYDRQVTPEDVTLREVVRNYNISYDNQGITAEDIDNDKLDVQHSAVTYNPVDTPASSEVTAPPASADETEKEDDPDDTVEGSADEKTEDTEKDNSDADAEKTGDSETAPDDNDELKENGDSEKDVADDNADETKDGDQDKAPEDSNEPEVTDGTEPTPSDNTENGGDKSSDATDKTETEEDEPVSSDVGEKAEEDKEPTSDNTVNEKTEENSDGENVTGDETVNEENKEEAPEKNDAEASREPAASEDKTEENTQNDSEENTSDDENNINDME